MRRNKGTIRTMMRRGVNGTSRPMMAKRRDRAIGIMAKRYNWNSTGWNERATRKKSRWGHTKTQKRSYRDNPVTTIFMYTNISHIGWGIDGTNKLTKVTDDADKL